MKVWTPPPRVIGKAVTPLPGIADGNFREWDRKNCQWCGGECKMPDWVIAGWFQNNPDKQRMAIVKWHQSVTTKQERIAAQRFKRSRRGYSCRKCRQFFFPKLTTCYWCRNDKKA